MVEHLDDDAGTAQGHQGGRTAPLQLGRQFMRDARDMRALRRQMGSELAVSGVSAPELEARLLMAHVLGCTPGDVFLHDDRPLEPEIAKQAMALLVRRISGEPVSRILGHREFWSLDFSLSPDTLVPRPDTETVVEAALEGLPEREAAWRILDLGTGSGAILAALLMELPNAIGLGVDRSGGAVTVARDNLIRAGVGERGCVMVGDWGASLTGGFDLVVSNPPYIVHAEIATLPREVRVHDPMLALDGGPDGLDAYRAIAVELPRLLVPGGLAVLELGIGQEQEVAALLVAAGLEVLGPALKDLGGIPRAICARKSCAQVAAD